MAVQRESDADKSIQYVSVCMCVHQSVLGGPCSMSGGLCHCHSSPFHISPAYAPGTFYFICLPYTKVWVIDGPTSASLWPFINCLMLKIGNSRHTHTHQYKNACIRTTELVRVRDSNLNPMKTEIIMVLLNAVLVCTCRIQQRAYKAASLCSISSVP